MQTRRQHGERSLTSLTAAVVTSSVLLWVLLEVRDVGARERLDTVQLVVVLLLLIVAFAATEVVQLQLEVNRQALLLSLSEIPFVLGLFVLPPHLLLLCRLVGLLVVDLPRTSPAKVAFNAVTVTTEVAAVYLVFASVAGGRPPEPTDPSAWGAAYVGLLVGTLLSGALVALAIRRLQGPSSRDDLLLMGATLLVSALLNTTVALLVLQLLEADLRTGFLLAVLLGGCTVAYRAYGQLLRRHRSLAQLQHLTAAWSQADGAREVSRALLLHGRPLLRAGHLELLLRGGDTAFSMTLGEREQTPREAASTEGADVLAQVAESGRTVLLRRTRGDRERPSERGLRDAIAVPLRHGGETFGVLLVANRLGDTSTFDAADVELVELIGAQAAVALHNGRLIDRLRFEATHDGLTGLPNRSAFQDAVGVALEGDERFHVLLMDLDGFKDVNDTLGHHHGDELLRAVGSRLRASLPSRVLVARLGGDEFAVLVPLLPTAPDGFGVADLLHRSLAKPFLVDGVQLDVRASVGVSSSPEDGLDRSTLLKRADIAMYEAKTTGVRVRAYDPAADRSSHRRLALVAELRGAIEDGELVCYFQPQLDLRTGLVTGAEALVRWPHPELGLVMPDDFIPIAEQAGLVVPLTVEVLRQSLTQAATWQGWGEPMGVAVNVSPRGLLAAGFVEVVTELLAETGTPPSRLTLEITESSVMADPGQAERVLHELHDAGVRLSVDDFGTGYSSLAYLQRLPVNEVKIDKSFVRELGRDPDRTAIVRAIIDMGHILGLHVLAEGVEDEPTARLLLDNGCDFAQGYLYSRALAPADFRTWSAARVPALRDPALLDPALLDPAAEPWPAPRQR